MSEPAEPLHQLTRADARRIALRAQLLTAERPTDLVETVRGLALLQLDPTKAVAPSADLVLWSRLGSTYDPQELRAEVDEQRLVEFRNTVRVADDMRLYTAEMAEWPGSGELEDWAAGRRDWLRANNDCRREILALLRSDGPLPQRELPDTCVVPWRSSGWNNNRNLTMMLDLLVMRGEVAVAGREGRDKLWDLASRIYPDDPPVPTEEALRLREQRRLGALGIDRPHGTLTAIDPIGAGAAGEAAVIEGVRGTWRVDPAQLGQPFAGRAALLSPLDRLLHDRRRMTDVFEFDYLLEMYKPADQRRWGYYALPVLYDDRLVGKLDARTELAEGVLRVHALHRDVPFTRAMTAAVEEEIRDLARWLDVEVEWPEEG